MPQVTWLPWASGAIVNFTAHVSSNGLMNSSFCVTDVDGVASRIVMRPSPTSLLPTQRYEAPAPEDGPSYVIFIAGSSFCHGDHSWKRCMSFSTANTASGAAAMDRLRSTWNVAGRVAAIDSTAITEMVINRNSEMAIFFSMGTSLGERRYSPRDA